MKISVHLITLNEERKLAEALRSLEGFADEIIVVDGGSKDRTVESATQLGAKIVHHPWEDSFAASRNAAKSATTGDWVFILDSDERLEPGSGEILKACARSGAYDAYLVTRVLRSAQGVPYETVVPRFAKYTQDMHFIYRVHEQLRPEITRAGFSKARVLHEQPSPAEKRAKLQFYLRLIELELKENPKEDRLYHRIERLSSRRELGYPAWYEGLDLILKQVNLGAATPPPGQSNILLSCALQAPASALPPGLRHLTLVEAAARWFPDNCVLLGLGAGRLHEAGRYQECAAFCERALKLLATGSFNRSFGFDAKQLGQKLELTLADARKRLFLAKGPFDFSKKSPPRS